jgi:hypothetical protein
MMAPSSYADPYAASPMAGAGGGASAPTTGPLGSSGGSGGFVNYEDDDGELSGPEVREAGGRF